MLPPFGEARNEQGGSDVSQPRVAIIMGSANDWETMRPAQETLDKLAIPSDVRVISAHRTPQRLTRYLADAEERGIEVVIAGAGGAAHLAGVTAAHTLLPVLGVPIDSSPLQGLDALLATVQMPGGIPVATFAIGKAGAKDAGLFAGAIIARSDAAVLAKLEEYDSDAGDLLDSIAASVRGTPASAPLEALKKTVGQYDFENAVEQIKDIISEYTPA